MENIVVDVDGFIYSQRQLKVRHPDVPEKLVTALVHDPQFNSIPNVYTEAALRRGSLLITCKTTWKDGKIYQLHVSDANPVTN